MKSADISKRLTAIIEEYVAKGAEIVHIGLDSFVDGQDGLYGLKIMVGGNEVERYYKLAQGSRGAVYGTKEEALAAAAKRNDRYMVKYTGHRPIDVTEKYFEVAKHVAQNKLGAKRVARAELKMEKYGRIFVVTYKGKIYRLK